MFSSERLTKLISLVHIFSIGFSSAALSNTQSPRDYDANDISNLDIWKSFENGFVDELTNNNLSPEQIQRIRIEARQLISDSDLDSDDELAQLAEQMQRNQCGAKLVRKH